MSCVTAHCGGKLAAWSESHVKGGDVENKNINDFGCESDLVDPSPE